MFENKMSKKGNFRVKLTNLYGTGVVNSIHVSKSLELYNPKELSSVLQTETTTNQSGCQGIPEWNADFDKSIQLYYKCPI